MYVRSSLCCFMWMLISLSCYKMSGLVSVMKNEEEKEGGGRGGGGDVI